MELYLDEMPLEVILKIFGYVNYVDLCRLKRTCKRFEEIITNWDHILLKNVTPIVTNQRNSLFFRR